MLAKFCDQVGKSSGIGTVAAEAALAATLFSSTWCGTVWPLHFKFVS